MLKRIHVDNYKCLTNFDLRFGEADAATWSKWMW